MSSYEFKINKNAIQKREERLREQLGGATTAAAATGGSDGSGDTLVEKYETAMRKSNKVVKEYLKIRAPFCADDHDELCYKEVFSNRKRLALKLLRIANEHNAGISHSLVYPVIACHKRRTYKKTGFRVILNNNKTPKTKGELQPVPGNAKLLIKLKQLNYGHRLQSLPYMYNANRQAGT